MYIIVNTVYIGVGNIIIIIIIIKCKAVPLQDWSGPRVPGS